MQIGLASAVTGDFALSSKSLQSDAELIRLIARGDKRAMHVLFGRHRLRVYRFALRLVRDKEAAEDLVSEVFLKVWLQAERFEGRCRVSTWVLAITRNLSLSMLRGRPMEALEDGAAEAIPDDRDDPETAVEKKQQEAILADCLRKLSRAHREVIDLVYYHERSIDEVAAIMGIPRNTVKTRMFYARNEVAKLLQRSGLHRAFPTAEARACKRHAPPGRSEARAPRGYIH